MIFKVKIEKIITLDEKEVIERKRLKKTKTLDEAAAQIAVEQIQTTTGARSDKLKAVEFEITVEPVSEKLKDFPF